MKYNRRLLKKLREEAGLTQKEFSKLAGVSLSIIQKIETMDEYLPRVTTAARLAYALGRPLDDFIIKEGSKNE